MGVGKLNGGEARPLKMAPEGRRHHPRGAAPSTLTPKVCPKAKPRPLFKNLRTKGAATTLGPKGRRPLSEAMHSEHDLKERQRRTNHSESFPLWGHNPSTQPAAKPRPLWWLAPPPSPALLWDYGCWAGVSICMWSSNGEKPYNRACGPLEMHPFWC